MPEDVIKIFETNVSVGRVYSGEIKVDGRSLPLPEGRWSVTQREAKAAMTDYIDTEKEDRALASIILVEPDAGDIKRVIHIQTSLLPRRRSAWLSGSGPCIDQRAYFSREVFAAKDGDHDCWWLRTASLSSQQFVTAGYFLNLDDDFLYYEIAFNPAFLPDGQPSGLRAPGAGWVPGALSTDKQAYIERLTSWARSFRPRLVPLLPR